MLIVCAGVSQAGQPTGCADCHIDEDLIDELTESLIVRVEKPEESDLQEGIKCAVKQTSYDLFEKILVKPDFLETSHGKVPCQTCHLGNAATDVYKEAHKGMVSDPSLGNTEAACSPCHPKITRTAKNSTHASGKNLYAAMERRCSPEQWKTLQEKGVAEKHCLSCHQSSCGSCHVSRPDLSGGGLRSGHLFEKTPDFISQCAPCHEEPVANDFMGAKSMGDVHYQEARMICSDCHGADELHSSGDNIVPKCIDCHENLEQGAIRHHALHTGKVDCTVCHSQAYQNCKSCHLGTDEEGIQYSQSETGDKSLKIGLNPEKDKPNEPEFVLVRQIPVRPDTYAAYLGEDLQRFNDVPTIKRTRSTHNIQRKTWQAAHCNHCHGNTDLFLTIDDVEPEFRKANQAVIVPVGKIPAAIPGLVPLSKPIPPKDPLIRVSAKWLNEHLRDDDLLIVDVRNEEHYEDDHIPGAYSLCSCHVRTNNLSKPPYMMLSAEELVEIFQTTIPLTPDKRVVVYGTGTSSRGLVFMALELMGHTKTSYLDDSFEGWEEMDYPTEDGPSPSFTAPAPYPVKARELLIDSKTIRKQMETGKLIVIDPRKASQFQGHTKRSEANHAGRIPGAINLPLQSLMNKEGHLRSREELSWIFRNLHIYPGMRGTIVTSCNTNALAAELFMILRSMGYDNVLVHDGSWIEWAEMTK